MATANLIETLPVTAGAVVRLYRFIALQADGKYDEAGAQGRADGVSAGAAAADGDLIAMALMRGRMKLEAGAAVSVGDLVASDAQGRAITKVATAGNFLLGVAEQAASAAGEVIEVLLHSPSEDGG
jgi:hypothetical protein